MEELIEVLKGVREDVDFEGCDRLVDDGVLESLDIVLIIAALTEHYDIEISAAEVVPENFNSAASLLKMVERLSEE